jgi:hypothetical protein
VLCARYLSHEPDKIETAALVGVAVAHFTNNHRRNPQHRGWGWASRFLNCAQLRPLRVPISALEFGGREDLNLCPLTGFFSRNLCKSLVSNGSHDQFRRSLLLFGHIWTQNPPEHLTEHSGDSPIILANHVGVSAPVLHA